MDTIIETTRPLEQALVFARSIYKGSQRFVRAVTETLSRLSPDQIKRGALIAGLTIESFIITDLTPYKGNPVLKAFRKDSTSAQVQTYDQPSTPELQTETLKEPLQSSEQNVGKKSSILEERLFKNFSPEDKASMKKKIDQQLKVYKNHDPNRAKRVLDNWKTTIDAILDLDVSPWDRQYWHQLLSALLYLEGAGSSLRNIEKPTETSTAGAEGPAQMTRTTAEAVAKKHGLYNINPENGWTSIRLARFHLADLIEKYGDLGIALTAYYGGESFANKKVSQALRNGRTNINIANLGSLDGEEYFIKIGAGMKHLAEVEH